MVNYNVMINFTKIGIDRGCWVHFKLSPVGGDTNRGVRRGRVSPPPTKSKVLRQFEMHPGMLHNTLL
jgi:hypothetical protein